MLCGKNGMKRCSISFSMRYYHLYDYYFHQVDTLSTELVFPERISSLEWILVFFYQILRINAYLKEHVFGILRGILGKIYSAIFKTYEISCTNTFMANYLSKKYTSGSTDNSCVFIPILDVTVNHRKSRGEIAWDIVSHCRKC